MNIANVAFRNLNRQKKRSFLLAAAVAFGILVITVVNGLVNGAVRISKDNIAQMAGGHIYLSMQKLEDDREINFIPDDAKLLAAAKAIGVDEKHMLRRSEFQAQFIFNGRTVNQRVSGIRWEDEQQALTKSLRFVEGSLDKAAADRQGLILSVKTAERLKAKLGDEVLVKTETVSGQQNVGSFVIEGLTEDQGLFGNLFAYATQSYVNELLNVPQNAYQSLTLRLEQPDLVMIYDAQLRKILGKDYALKAPIDPLAQQGPIMRAPKKEKWDGLRVSIDNITEFSSFLDTIAGVVNGVGLGVLLLMLLITMIGVINTFRMIMYERVQEIGTLRAMGMQKGTVSNIMVMEATFLSLGGVVIGTVLAAIVMGIVSLIDFGTGSALSFFLQAGHLTFSISVASVIINTILVVLLTMFAAGFPARKAARLHPADALRAVY